jgi:hypothetical protein
MRIRAKINEMITVELYKTRSKRLGKKGGPTICRPPLGSYGISIETEHDKQ